MRKKHREKITSPLLLWFGISSIWFLYRATTMLPEWIEEIILKPLIFVGPVMLLLNFRHSLNVTALGLRFKPVRPILVWGMLLGTGLVIEALVVALYKGNILRTQLSVTLLVNNLLISSATAFSEEILYRGFLMERFWQLFKNPWSANILSATLFMLAHVGQALFVLHYQNSELFKYLGSMILLGVINGFIYYKTRSVIASGFFHTLWNFAIPFIG